MPVEQQRIRSGRRAAAAHSFRPAVDRVLLQAVMGHTTDAIAIVGADGGIREMSAAARRLLGPLVADGRLGEEQWRAHVHPSDAHLLDDLPGSSDAGVELRLPDTDGQVRHLRVWRTAVHRDDPCGWVIWTAADVTEQRRIESQLEYSSLHDTLTGLANRRQVELHLAASLHQAARDGVPLGVLYLDLDRFAAINDTLGHSAGDHVLKSIGARLERSLRSVDCLARVGVDAFVAVVQLRSRASNPWMDEITRVSAVANRMLQQVSLPVVVGGEVIAVSASIGIAMSGVRADDPQTLLRNAETALHRAKSEGRNRVAFFDTEMRQQADERRHLERQLRSSAIGHQLRLLFQPIVDLASGAVVGLEALLRWCEADGTVVLPGELLPIAEDTGAIAAINTWVLEQATDALAELQHDPRIPVPPFVSINTTAAQVASERFVEQVRAALAASGAEPSGLVVEITEHGLLGDVEACQRTLDGLHQLGVRIALDDFGTGYSSLSYLHHLPFDMVKIDRAFTQSLDDDGGAEQARLVHAIIALARSLGLQPIAEGVETATQLASLVDAGCLLGQGWDIARPGTIEDALVMLGGPY